MQCPILFKSAILLPQLFNLTYTLTLFKAVIPQGIYSYRIVFILSNVVQIDGFEFKRFLTIQSVNCIVIFS